MVQGNNLSWTSQLDPLKEQGIHIKERQFKKSDYFKKYLHQRVVYRISGSAPQRTAQNFILGHFV